jgi:hypothetical protein
VIDALKLTLIEMMSLPGKPNPLARTDKDLQATDDHESVLTSDQFFGGDGRCRSVSESVAREQRWAQKSVERFDLGDLALMNFRNPNRNRRCGVVHIDVSNICVHSWQHVLGKTARLGIEAKD